MTLHSQLAAARGTRLLLDFSVLAPGGAEMYAHGFLRALATLVTSQHQALDTDFVILLPHRGLEEAEVALREASCSVVRSRTGPPDTWRSRLSRQVAVSWWSFKLRATHVFVPREIAPVFLRGRVTLLAHNLLLWRSQPEVVRADLLLRCRRLAARAALHRADAVVAPSLWCALYLPRSDVVVTPHGCDLSPIQLSEKIDSDLQDSGEIRLLCLGVGYSYKRFEIAIEVAAGLRRRGVPVSLEIWGALPDGRVEATLRNRSREVLGSDPLKGWLPPERRADVYRRSDVLFVGTSFESFGFPLLEAMRTSTVVLAPSSALIDEICGPDAITYDEGSATSAIESLIAHLPQLDTIATSAFARAADYDWERCVSATLRTVLGD